VAELASGWEAFAFGLIFLFVAAFAAERLRSLAPRQRPFGLPCAARSGRDRPKTRPLRGLRHRSLFFRPELRCSAPPVWPGDREQAVDKSGRLECDWWRALILFDSMSSSGWSESFSAVDLIGGERAHRSLKARGLDRQFCPGHRPLTCRVGSVLRQ
jgi:hypothetical protein